MYPEAVALRDSGFDAVSIVEHLLNTYITFCFGDVKIHSTGMTGVMHLKNPSPGQKRFKIRVTISPQTVWSLLVSDYTASEKAVASTIVASLLLHELAVSLPLKCESTTNLG